MYPRISQKTNRTCVRESAFHSKSMGLKVEFCVSHWNAEFLSVFFFPMMYSAVCKFTFTCHLPEFLILWLGYAVTEIFTVSQWFFDGLPNDMECDHGEKSHGLPHMQPPLYYIFLPQLQFLALTSSHLSYLTVQVDREP
jgi:hypothetical protein